MEYVSFFAMQNLCLKVFAKNEALFDIKRQLKVLDEGEQNLLKVTL